MGEIKRIDIKEFRALGYLQEANRLFFHPLGLALEVIVEIDGSERLGGVWDYRNDPEVILYSEDCPLSLANSNRIENERIAKAIGRMGRYWSSWSSVQPIPHGKL